MTFVYGWGATAVILGALFKIMHFPGAPIILTAGMLVEAAIFFLSVFDPPIEHYNWAKVFPELVEGGEPSVAPAKMGGNASFNLDIIDEDVKNQIKDGLTKLAKSVEDVKDITESTVAAQKYKEMIVASTTSMGEFTKNTSELNSAITSLSSSVKTSSDGFSKVGESVNKYQENTNELNTKLSSLNTLFDLQIKHSQEVSKSTENVSKSMNNISENLSSVVVSSKDCKESAVQLGKNISDLNNLYGSMLSVFNNQK